VRRRIEVLNVDRLAYGIVKAPGALPSSRTSGYAGPMGEGCRGPWGSTSRGVPKE